MSKGVMQIEPHQQILDNVMKQSVMSIIPLQFRQICQRNGHEEQMLLVVSCHVIRSVSMVKAAVTPLTSEHPPSLSRKNAVAQFFCSACQQVRQGSGFGPQNLGCWKVWKVLVVCQRSNATVLLDLSKWAHLSSDVFNDDNSHKMSANSWLLRTCLHCC